MKKRSVADELESYAHHKARKEQADADLAEARISLNICARQLAIDKVKATAKLAKPEYAELIDSLHDMVFDKSYRSEFSSFVVAQPSLVVHYSVQHMSYSVELDGVKYGLGWNGTKFGNLRTKRAREMLGPLGPFIAWMKSARLSGQFWDELQEADRNAVAYCERNLA